MSIKLHYIITFVALCSLGVIAAKPERYSKDSLGERVCRQQKGKMVCDFIFNEDRIQTTFSSIELSNQ